MPPEVIGCSPWTVPSPLPVDELIRLVTIVDESPSNLGWAGKGEFNHDESANGRQQPDGNDNGDERNEYQPRDHECHPHEFPS